MASDRDFASIRSQYTRRNSKERRLARAVRSRQGQNLANRKLEIDSAQNRSTSDLDRDVAK